MVSSDNLNPSKKLVCIYSFLPYTDTSANIVAKRIYEEQVSVDIIHNKMDRPIDESLYCFIEDYVNNDILIGSIGNPQEWKNMKLFLEEGSSNINKLIKNGEYEELYSRAMFPVSHLLAFEYKMMNPSVKWTAEFSDPVLYDLDDNIRFEAADKEYMEKINIFLEKNNLKLIEDNNIYFLSEYLPYLFADNIMFTNVNQREYMLHYLKDSSLKENIMKKSIIKPHPIPDKKFYNIIKSNYEIDKTKVNIAYFGILLKSRNLNDIFSSLYTLKDELKEKCKIHLFIPDAQNYQHIINCMPIKENIQLNSYVPYLEFLNLSKKFDCLIVSDSKTSNFTEKNPFLPSKISDYLGSGSEIWGICEKNSPMAKYNIKYKSSIDNLSSIRKTLEKIITDYSEKES